MEEILDPLEHTMLQYLPVSEFIKLCQTSSTFAQFCNNDNTWRYFIGRDFGIEYQGKNPRQEYFGLERRRKEDEMIQDWIAALKFSLDRRSGGGFWILLDLVGYKLKEKVPNFGWMWSPLKDMATTRMTAILCHLSLEQIETLESDYRKFLDTLENYTDRFRDQRAPYIISQGKEYYDKILVSRDLLDSLPTSIPNSGLYIILTMFSNKTSGNVINHCQTLYHLVTDDPVLRNLQ